MEFTRDEMLTLKRMLSEYKRGKAPISPIGPQLQHQGTAPAQIMLGQLRNLDGSSIGGGFGAVQGYHTASHDGYDVNKGVMRYLYQVRWMPFNFDQLYLREGFVHGPTHARVWRNNDDEKYLDGFVFSEQFVDYTGADFVMGIKTSIGWILLPIPDVSAQWRAMYEYGGSASTTLTTSYTRLTPWNSEHSDINLNSAEKNGYAFGPEWDDGVDWEETMLNVPGMYEFEFSGIIDPGSTSAVQVFIEVQQYDAAYACTGANRVIQVAANDLRSHHFGRIPILVASNVTGKPYKWSAWWNRVSGSATGTIQDARIRVIRVAQGTQLNAWPTNYATDTDFQDGPGVSAGTGGV
jgi:hypothetical protein